MGQIKPQLVGCIGMEETDYTITSFLFSRFKTPATTKIKSGAMQYPQKVSYHSHMK